MSHCIVSPPLLNSSSSSFYSTLVRFYEIDFRVDILALTSVFAALVVAFFFFFWFASIYALCLAVVFDASYSSICHGLLFVMFGLGSSWRYFHP